MSVKLATSPAAHRLQVIAAAAAFLFVLCSLVSVDLALGVGLLFLIVVVADLVFKLVSKVTALFVQSQ